MSREIIGDLVDRYLNDPTFRSAFTADPDGAVRDAGFILEDHEIAALHASVSGHANHALQSRSSKYSFGS